MIRPQTNASPWITFAGEPIPLPQQHRLWYEGVRRRRTLCAWTRTVDATQLEKPKSALITRLSSHRLTTFAALIALLVVAAHFVGLASSPPGLFRDEAAFGYNGWTIAHFGVDQYGAHWPLFFRSFGDYKGPLGVYLEALLTAFLPMAPGVIRLPNAVAGSALAFAAGWLAWRLTRSEIVFLILCLEAAFEPWFFHLGRTMLEVDLFTPLCYVVTLALLCAGGERRLRTCIAAGFTLGAACFTAQPARFFTPVLLLIVLYAFRSSLRGRRLLALVAPVAIASAVLLVSAAKTTARLSDVSVFSGRGLVNGLELALGDFLQYLSPWLLFLHGDGNLRHSTGFEGLFLVTAALPVAIGVVVAIRRRTEPIATIALLVVLLAPAAASLAVGVNARRDVISMPAFLIFLVYGWEVLVRWLGRHRLRAVAVALLVVLAAVPYYLDYALAYPNRAAVAFQVGGQDAVVRAHRLANGRPILISDDISPDVLVALEPEPSPGDAFANAGFRVIHSQADVDAAQPGDLLVLTPHDRPPAGAVLLFREVTTGPIALGGPAVQTTVVSIYRR